MVAAAAPQGIHIEITAAIRLFFLGLFYNNLMPGSVGGDLVKAWYVTKHTEKRLEGVLSVFMDRLIGLFGVILMAVVTYLAFVWGRATIWGGTGKAGAPQWLAQCWGVVLWTAAAIGAVLAVLLAHPVSRVRLACGVRRCWDRGISALGRVKDAVVVYCSRPWTLLWAMGLTFISQSTVIVAFWLLGRNLGVEAGLRYYFVIFPVTWVIGAIPISPAGLGITEAGTVGLFALLTGTQPALPLLALCQRFVWILASLPGGLIHLLGAHLPPQEISVDGQGRAN